MIEKYSNLLGINDWVTKVIFVLIVVISINIFTKVILINLKKQIELTENNWDDALVSSLFRPITFIVWMLGIIFTVQLFNENMPPAILRVKHKDAQASFADEHPGN